MREWLPELGYCYAIRIIRTTVCDQKYGGSMVDLTALGLPLGGLMQGEEESQNSGPLPRIEMVDGLTRIFHREFFNVQYAIQWGIAARKQDPLALFVIDVDQFGPFNALDSRSGDYALQKIAKTLSLLFRRSTDFVARYEGDRFVVLAADMSETQAKAHALRICDRVQSLRILNRQTQQYLSVSVGYVVDVPHADQKPEGMLEMACDNLKHAKSSGQGTIHGTGTGILPDAGAGPAEV